MSLTVTDVAVQIADLLMETSAFSSGLWTPTEVRLRMDECQQDFLMRTGVVKKVTTIQCQNNVRLYTVPADCLVLHRVRFGGKPLYRTDAANLDRDEPNWRKLTGRPTQYHQDLIGVNQFELDRAPTSTITGLNYVAVGTYGTLRSMVGAYTYTGVIPAAGSGGTLRKMQGVRTYLAILPSGGGGGVLRGFAGKPATIELTYTVRPATLDAMSAPLTVPDWCSPYIMWGTMERLLMKPGEGQDISRSQYCRQRYLIGAALVRRLLGYTNNLDARQFVSMLATQ